MMAPEDILRVKESFARIAPSAEHVAADFYARLFVRDPKLRAMFPADMETQGRKLLMALTRAVAALDRIEEAVPALRELGARHRGYGVKAGHYRLVGEVLIDTLHAADSPHWSPALAAAWGAVYGLVSGAMRDGAAAKDRHAA